MSWIFESIYCLLGLALVLVVVVGMFAPFESMSWWAGWTEHGLDPEPDPETVAMPELLRNANSNAEHYVVYLTGIGGFSGDYLAEREIEFIKRVENQFGDDIVLVRDVFPFAVGNNPLNGERLTKGLWDWVHARQLANNMDITTFLICARNAFQVAVSGDSRYGPLNNYGVAREVALSLIKHGYKPGGGKRITLIGYSGGGQMSIGINRYLSKAFDVPVQIISVGGVMSDDPGFDTVEHLYQIIGGKDFFPKTGIVLYPRRWPIVPHSHWNRIKRDGRVTTINPGDEIYHVGGEDYYSVDGKLPSGQSYMDKIVEIVADVLKGDTQKYIAESKT